MELFNAGLHLVSASAHVSVVDVLDLVDYPEELEDEVDVIGLIFFELPLPEVDLGDQLEPG